MAGLLDFIKTPEGQGLLSAAAGAMAGARPGQPWNTAGRGLLAGVAGYGGALDRQQEQQQLGLLAKDRAQMQEMRDLQMGQMRTEMDRQKGEQAWWAGLPNVQQQALPQTYNMVDTLGDGTGVGSASTTGNPQSLQDYARLPNSPFAKDILSQSLFPKAADYKVVGGSLVQVGPNGVTEAYRAPDKPEAAPTSVREYQFAQTQGYQGSYEQFQRDMKRAGASNVNVPINMGQKGFDNTLKLRGDFRSEPIYKAHQEMTTAYGQIQQSLKQASPAGDLAGATKIMKLLDPGSVVRESELGMAMAASGALDRLQHYATNVINGTKLTPTQRQDFQRLADALYGESNKLYNTKRGEYQGIAERNGLDVQDVLGAESQPPKPNKTVKRTGMLNGRKVVEYSDGSTGYAD